VPRYHGVRTHKVGYWEAHVQDDEAELVVADLMVREQGSPEETFVHERNAHPRALPSHP